MSTERSAAPGRAARVEWLVSLLDRRLLDVDRLATTARETSGDLETCSAWLAVERQAARYELALRPWLRQTQPELAEKLVSVQSALEAQLAAARAVVATFQSELQRQARARLGLRIAVVGKGGSGKSVLAGTLCRLLAQRGRRVLAADLDFNPGLAYSLGIGSTEAGLPAEALEERPGADFGWHLAPDLSPAEAVERFATSAPDGARYLGVGKISVNDMAWATSSAAAVIGILRGFGDPGWDVVGDLGGGPTPPFQGCASFADLVIVVVGPSWVSGLTARRLLRLVEQTETMVVSNRTGASSDLAGVVPVVRIPADPEVLEAERRGVAAVDHCPDACAVRAIDHLADLLTLEEVPA